MQNILSFILICSFIFLKERKAYWAEQLMLHLIESRNWMFCAFLGIVEMHKLFIVLFFCQIKELVWNTNMTNLVLFYKLYALAEIGDTL